MMMVSIQWRSSASQYHIQHICMIAALPLDMRSELFLAMEGVGRWQRDYIILPGKIPHHSPHTPKAVPKLDPGMALHAALWMHAGAGHYRRRRLSSNSPPLLLVACLAVLVLPQPRISRAAATSTVVTHLPGFDGPLPFYLETG